MPLLKGDATLNYIERCSPHVGATLVEDPRAYALTGSKVLAKQVTRALLGLQKAGLSGL